MQQTPLSLNTLSKYRIVFICIWFPKQPLRLLTTHLLTISPVCAISKSKHKTKTSRKRKSISASMNFALKSHLYKWMVSKASTFTHFIKGMCLIVDDKHIQELILIRKKQLFGQLNHYYLYVRRTMDRLGLSQKVKVTEFNKIAPASWIHDYKLHLKESRRS